MQRKEERKKERERERERETGPLLTPYTRINWIKVLNERHEAVKLEENISSKLSEIALNNIIFGYISSGKGNKRKNKQMGLQKTKRFCTAKETINDMKKQCTKWEKILPMIHLIRY